MNAFQSFSFEDIIRYGVSVVILASVILAVLYSIWGGLLLVTSGGKEEKVKPAVNHIRHAVIGIVVLMVVLFVAPIFVWLFGLNYPEEIRPSSIFQTIQEMSSNLFGKQTAIESSTDTSSYGIGSDFTDL